MAEHTAEFFRGPYDGLLLTLEQTRAYCHLVTVSQGEQEKLFVIMPPLLDWDRVVRG